MTQPDPQREQEARRIEASWHSEEWARIARGIAGGRLTGSTTHARILAKKALALQYALDAARLATVAYADQRELDRAQLQAAQEHLEECRSLLAESRNDEADAQEREATLREALERLASTEGFIGAISVNNNHILWVELTERAKYAQAAIAATQEREGE